MTPDAEDLAYQHALALSDQEYDALIAQAAIPPMEWEDDPRDERTDDAACELRADEIARREWRG